MRPAHCIGLILAGVLLVNSFVGAPAMAQQDEAAVVSKRALELHQAGKFSEAIPLGPRGLAIQENALGPDDLGARGMAGFGDPVFEAAEEAKAVTEWREQARVDVARASGGLDGIRIDRAKLPQDRALYFATDGFIAGDVAGFGEPSLVSSLSKQQTELDEGLLTASQVAQLRPSADCAVPCNTVAADKGAPSGLARACCYAGAVVLLVPRWSVRHPACRIDTLYHMKTDPKCRRAAAIRNAMLAYVGGKGSAECLRGHFPSSERERRDE
jgi:hypothetical protein